MKKITKRISLIKNGFDYAKKYNLFEGISILKRFAVVNFVESCDVSVHLGIDPKKSEQNIRGYVSLPHGHGRNLRVVAFVQGEYVDFAKNAGADLVGLYDIIEYVKNKKNKFDVVVATPDIMQKITSLGVVLGPRGLMPNPKFGTVSEDIVEIIKKIKISQIQYRNDKYGIVHASIGRMNFNSEYLKENLESLIIDLKKNKPLHSKGVYVKKVIISSTMGPAVQVDQSTIYNL